MKSCASAKMTISYISARVKFKLHANTTQKNNLHAASRLECCDLGIMT